MASTVSGIIQYEEQHHGGGRAVAEGILTVLEAIRNKEEIETPFGRIDPQVTQGMQAGAMMGVIPR
jgi:hypothetical protein